MADLGPTIVRGNLSSTKIYENGTALDDKFGAQLSIQGSSLILKSASGNTLSSISIPAATVTPTTTTSSNISASDGIPCNFTVSYAVNAGYISSLASTTYSKYINDLTIPAGKTLRVNANSGTLTYLSNWNIAMSGTSLTFTYKA